MVGHSPYDELGISGTTLNELIEKRNVKDWTNLSFSSIYYILNQLVSKKLIKTKGTKNSASTQSEVGAPQKVFLVTFKGKEVLKKTVIDYFKRSNLTYKEMNLALASAYVFKENELLNILYIQRNLLEERMSKVRLRYTEDKTEESGSEMPIHVWGLFRYAFGMLTARKKFLNELIIKIEEE
jgi:DNA-binding PadR family transcriptional regulator